MCKMAPPKGLFSLVPVRFLLMAFGALGRKSQRAQKGELCADCTGGCCEYEGWPRVAFFPRFFSMRVLRFMMLGDCWGQIHRFRPRCTDRAPEWPPKREMPGLASQAFATDPFLRFFQAKHARKLRLTDPECASTATQRFRRRI